MRLLPNGTGVFYVDAHDMELVNVTFKDITNAIMVGGLPVLRMDGWIDDNGLVMPTYYYPCMTYDDYIVFFTVTDEGFFFVSITESNKIVIGS